MDLNRALRIAIKTGDVLIGSNRSVDAVKSGKAKLVILASNCPIKVREAIENEDVFIYNYPEGSVDLGAACGKPFSMAALAVLDPGESELSSIQGFRKKVN